MRGGFLASDTNVEGVDGSVWLVSPSGRETIFATGSQCHCPSRVFPRDAKQEIANILLSEMPDVTASSGCYRAEHRPQRAKTARRVSKSADLGRKEPIVG